VKEPNVDYRIRKNSLIEDVYLARDGTWTTWKLAAKHGIEVYGIF